MVFGILLASIIGGTIGSLIRVLSGQRKDSHTEVQISFL